MNAGAASTMYGWHTKVWWDGPVATGDWIAMRFALDDVPSGTTVTSASLDYYVMNGGDTAEVYYLQCPFDETTTTWGNINSGSAFTEADCMRAKIGDATGNIHSYNTLDVTSAVSYWLNNPSSNMGVVFKPSGGNNGVGVLTSERAGYSPKLSVTISETLASPPPPAFPPPGNVSSSVARYPRMSLQKH